MHIKAKQAFSWAHRGVHVEEFTKGQIIETDDEDLIKVSVSEGWAEKAKTPNKADQKNYLVRRIADLEAALLAADASEEAALVAELATAKNDLAAI